MSHFWDTVNLIFVEKFCRNEMVELACFFTFPHHHLSWYATEQILFINNKSVNKVWFLAIQTFCTGVSGIWSPTTSSCFKFYPYIGGINFDGGLTKCSNHGTTGVRGRLAHIKTAEAQAIVGPMGTTRAWVGGRAAVTTSTDLGKDWRWVDGSAASFSACFDYVHSATGGMSSGGCISIKDSGGTWDDDVCTNLLNAYICEFVEGQQCLKCNAITLLFFSF